MLRLSLVQHEALWEPAKPVVPTSLPDTRPAPLVEVVPARPAPEYRWIKGHYVWVGNHWDWVRGHWALD